MKIESAEVQGFRGLAAEKFALGELTVFTGEMGSGKTSRLLALLYNLTGSAPQGLSLDDLINVHSDFMWVRVSGIMDDKPFSLERRKRRGLASTVKTDLARLPSFDQKILIEGREIAQLLTGGPAEKALKLDALLGLLHYNEAASSVTTAPIERRKEELARVKSDQSQLHLLAEEVQKAEREKDVVSHQLQELEHDAEQNKALYPWAEEVMAKVEEERRKRVEAEGILREIARLRGKLAAIPPFPTDLEDATMETQAKHDAIQRRLTFLESAMQTLDLQGAKVEELSSCPLCGAPISPGSLSKLTHYGEEYQQYISEATKVADTLKEMKAQLDRSRREREEANLLRNQISSLGKQATELSSQAPPQADIQKASQTLARGKELSEEARDLRFRLAALEDKLQSYARLSTTMKEEQALDIDESMRKLDALKTKLEKIKTALIEAVNEVRAEQFDRLKSDFKEAFHKVYPYPRFSDIDFERITLRGREVLAIKAKTDDRWLYSHQMSTGENVAISFALLYAVNKLEKAPVLLLDEPEEGLDSKGVEGLADVLNRLKVSTQIVVATRSQQLAAILSPVTQADA